MAAIESNSPPLLAFERVRFTAKERTSRTESGIAAITCVRLIALQEGGSGGNQKNLAHGDGGDDLTKPDSAVESTRIV